MADIEYVEHDPRRGRFITAIIAVVIIGIMLLNDGCRDRLHHFYNLIPPRRAKLTIALQSGPDDFLENQNLVFDGRDTLTTDNEGDVIIDDLPLGKHAYTILYGDSLHRYSLNLRHDSIINVTLHMQGKDDIEGVQAPTGKRGEVEVESHAGKVLMFGTQWFTPGNTVQFGAICVKLIKLDNPNNDVYVTVCHTVTNFVCQTTIVENTELSRANWVKFSDGGYNYKLVLDKIDQVSETDKTIAAFVSLTQAESK